MRTLVLLLVLVSSQAGAATITYWVDQRALGFSYSAPDDRNDAGSSQPNPRFGDWTLTDGLYGPGSSASQHSELRPQSITAEGWAAQGQCSPNLFSIPCSTYTTSSSIVRLTFTVDEDSPFELAGTLGNMSSAIIRRFEGSNYYEPTVPFVGASDPGQFSIVGVLLAGERYELRGGSGANNRAEMHNAFSFSLTLLPVPEPTTAALLAIGLAAIARRRGRA